MRIKRRLIESVDGNKLNKELEYPDNNPEDVTKSCGDLADKFIRISNLYNELAVTIENLNTIAKDLWKTLCDSLVAADEPEGSTYHPDSSETLCRVYDKDKFIRFINDFDQVKGSDINVLEDSIILRISEDSDTIDIRFELDGLVDNRLFNVGTTDELIQFIRDGGIDDIVFTLEGEVKVWKVYEDTFM